MKISFLFPNESVDLVVELVDNPAIASWAEHFKTGFSAKANLQNYYEIFEYDAVKIQSYLDICHERIRQLNALGYAYSGPLPDTIDKIDRDFTNQLHRFFTHNQHAVNHGRWDNLTFEEHVAKQKMLTGLLQDVNENVHLIERYLRPVPNVDPTLFREIYLSAEPSYNDPSWWPMEDSHRQYHSDAHADVIFGSQILGKTLIRSYLDGDDPDDWDTTGHYNNNGTLQILPTTGREAVYRSEGFNQWLIGHGLDRSQVFFDFPVGNIVNRSILPELQNKIAYNSNLVSVRYSF